jgi:hypothetical protein
LHATTEAAATIVAANLDGTNPQPIATGLNDPAH